MSTAAPSADSASIWRALERDLTRFVARRVPPEDVDDLVQETFVRIHARLGELERAEAVRAWVYRVARSVVVDYHRRKRPFQPLPDLEAPPEALVSEGPASPDLSPLVGGWLLEMIDGLPDRYREALSLTEVEGLSQREAAERLGLSVSGAKSRVQRGRAMLRERFDRCCQLEFDRAGRVVEIAQAPECCD